MTAERGYRKPAPVCFSPLGGQRRPGARRHGCSLLIRFLSITDGVCFVVGGAPEVTTITFDVCAEGVPVASIETAYMHGVTVSPSGADGDVIGDGACTSTLSGVFTIFDASVWAGSPITGPGAEDALLIYGAQAQLTAATAFKCNCRFGCCSALGAL